MKLNRIKQYFSCPLITPVSLVLELGHNRGYPVYAISKDVPDLLHTYIRRKTRKKNRKQQTYFWI